ncbi:MAG: sterol desaturase family protein [Alphaproteobacteria bacterium]|nr:sterol desaturase family protein [Alphaproteobacteria bacterium]
MSDITNPQDDDTAPAREKRSDWNHSPKLPIHIAPYFNWPPEPARVMAWLARAWFPITERAVVLAIALVTWFYLTPALERCREFAAGWIAEVYLRNLGLMIVVAGGLHLYLYTFSKQGKKLKYDHRELARKNRNFSFRDQVLDNMYWTLASGVTVWTAYEVFLLWGYANGYAAVLAWSDNPVWFVVLFALLPFWQAFSFYWVHRLLHWPPLYRLAHTVHHRNSNIGPWSGNSMHPVEHVLWLSSVMIHWVVASHPVHILFYQQMQVLSAVTSHAGFEGLLVKGKNSFVLGEFFHQLHHRYHECNYGSSETHWDRLFGTFHDGSQQATEEVRQRRRAMHGTT